MVARSQRMVNPGTPRGTMGSDSREGPEPAATRILGVRPELLRRRRVDPAPHLHKRHLIAEGFARVQLRLVQMEATSEEWRCASLKSRGSC